MFALLVYALLLATVTIWLPSEMLDLTSSQFLMAIGAFAMWRYSWGVTHFGRALIFKHLVFPKMRREADALGAAARPGHLYLLITSFRIDTETTIRVIRGAALEAVRVGAPATLVASIVDAKDERIFRSVLDGLGVGDKVRLMIVRLPGSGKRDGLAGALRAIRESNPPKNAIVALIDGDTELTEGALTRTVGFFQTRPNMDALTTDEICELHGRPIYKDFYNLRFAQRQIQMCSVALSNRVLTLTGRMSLYRAEVALSDDFIDLLQNDYIEHPRLGRIKFLTGDDKSTWYHILKSGREMLYVPDVQVITVEHPPHKSLFVGATILMRRWFGNMLRNGTRAIGLGPKPMGFFVWWCLIDQRLSMWTSLVGPVAALGAFVFVSPMAVFAYLYWISATRVMQTAALAAVRGEASWRYPFLLYFLQIWGSLVKIFILFRLDRQSWTRQKTKAVRDIAPERARFLARESFSLHALSMAAFVLVVLAYAGVIGSSVHADYTAAFWGQ